MAIDDAIFDADEGGSGLVESIQITSSQIPLGSSGTSVIVPGIVSPEFGSANFNGNIPKERVAKNITGATFDTAVSVGDFVYLKDNNTPYVSPTDDTIHTNGTMNTYDNYLIVAKSTDTNPILTVSKNGTLVTIPAITAGTLVYIVRESWAGKTIGTSGWAVTAGGNAIFANVAVRGNITATSGTIGTNTSKWYIGNPFSNGIIANWDQTTSAYPSNGSGGVSLNSAGTIEGFDAWVNTSFTVTGVTYVNVSGINYYRYTTSTTHSIQPGNGVFITGLSRYNNDPLTRYPAPITNPTTNTFDIDVAYIADSYTAPISGQSGTVWTAQRLFGIGTGVALNADIYMPTYSTTTDGLYFTNTARIPTTQILADGQAVFRGLSSLDTPSTAFIHINPNQANISTYISGANTYISPGAFIIREVIPSSSGSANGLTIDSNEIQQVSIAKASGIEYMSGGTFYLNRLGGNIIIGGAISGQLININAGTYSSDIYAADVSGSASERAMYIRGNDGTVPYRLGTLSSTRRVKQQIFNAEEEIISSRFLELEPVKFKYNSAVEEFGDENTPFYYGFIAENAEELGLTYLYGTDSGGLPDYFAHEKMPVYLFTFIKKQQQKIEELEQRLAILEG